MTATTFGKTGQEMIKLKNLYNSRMPTTRLIRWLLFFLSIAFGMGLGLYYGWVVNPVKYVDTTPDTLRADFRDDYILMAAEIYHQDHDLQAAIHRIGALGGQPAAILASQTITNAEENGYAADDLQLIKDLVVAMHTLDFEVTPVIVQPSGITP
jgi:hypothetical protein